MNELWPVYNNLGEPTGQNKSPADMLAEGSLHAASHVWIWRKGLRGPEVLLQKRASTKQTWPNKYDISAAGHIDTGETPIIAALREAKEEINLDIEPSQLQLFNVYRAHMVAESGLIENEFQWLYLLELSGDISFTLQEDEVGSIEWITLRDFKTQHSRGAYVPHGDTYYQIVIEAIELVYNS